MVPKRCSDMMSVGRLQGFDVRCCSPLALLPGAAAAPCGGLFASTRRKLILSLVFCLLCLCFSLIDRVFQLFFFFFFDGFYLRFCHLPLLRALRLVAETGRTLPCLLGPALSHERSFLPRQVVGSRGPLPFCQPWEPGLGVAVFVSLAGFSASC